MIMMKNQLRLVVKDTDQVSFTWRPTDNLMVRGGWGESFAAPSLPYIYKGFLKEALVHFVTTMVDG